MSEPENKAEEKKQESGGLGSIGVGAIVSTIMGVVAAAAGAGWPGVVALALVGLGLPLAWQVAARMVNGWIDSRDLTSAGSDAGKTAVDLASQGREVSAGLDSAQKTDPPTAGFPQNQ